MSDSFTSLLKLWDIKPDSLNVIRDMMNCVYSAETVNHKKVIVRVSYDFRRNKNDILAELEWINYLGKHSNQFTKPITNQENSLFESYDDAGELKHVCCFEFHEGGQEVFMANPEWGPDLFKEAGRLTGLIHRLTADYQSKYPVQQWYEEDAINDLSVFSDKVSDKALEMIAHNIETLKKYPHEKYYNIVHGDLKPNNFFLEPDGRIFLFDFDQMCMCWNVYDFLPSLYCYYSFPLIKNPNANDCTAKEHIKSLMEGYSLEYDIDRAQLKMIPDLLNFLESSWFLFLKQREDKIDNMTKKVMMDDALSELQTMEQRIIERRPQFGFDFEAL